MFLSLFALATGPEITLTNESHTVSVHVGLGDSGKGAGVFSLVFVQPISLILLTKDQEAFLPWFHVSTAHSVLTMFGENSW